MDTKFLSRAIELARESISSGGGPFGAVVVRQGKIVGEGTNRVVPGSDPTAHAEIVAIRNAAAALGDHRLSGCELYASCEPCPMCLGAIHWARIERAWFAASREDAARAGFDDEHFYRELALPANERKLSMVRALAEEGLSPFELWRAKDDRAPY